MKASERQTELLLSDPPTDISLAQRDIAEAHAAGRSGEVARLSAFVDRYLHADHPQDRRRLLQVVRELREEYQQRRSAP